MTVLTLAIHSEGKPPRPFVRGVFLITSPPEVTDLVEGRASEARLRLSLKTSSLGRADAVWYGTKAEMLSLADEISAHVSNCGPGEEPAIVLEGEWISYPLKTAEGGWGQRINPLTPDVNTATSKGFSPPLNMSNPQQTSMDVFAEV